MKKQLLFMCAFLASLTVGAQTNLALNKSVSVIYSPGDVSSLDLSRIVDGDNNTNVILPVSSTDGTDITALTIDLTSANSNIEIGRISIVQDGRHATQYKIYGTNTAPSSYSSKSDLLTAAESWTELVNCTNDGNAGGDNTVYTKDYAASANSGFQYIIFIPLNNAYGVSLRQICVYEKVASILTSFTLPNYIFANYQVGVDVDAILKDQSGLDFEGASLSFDGETPVSAEIRDNKKIVVGAVGLEGVYILKANSGDVTLTQKIAFVKNGPENPTALSDDVYALYSDVYGTTDYNGWNPGWEWGYGKCDELTLLNNNKCVRVHNVGTWAFGYTLDDLTPYTKLEFDVYTIEDISGHVKIEGTNKNNIPFTTKGGEWKHVTLDLEGLQMAGGNKWVDFFFGENASDKDRDILIDNVYLSKPGAEVEVTALSITAEANEIQAGKTLKLTVKNQDNATISADRITFVSSDVTKATVAADGTVTGVAEGEVTITATLTGSDPVISNTINLTVTPAPAGLELTAGGHTILLNAYHYVADSRYELVITSEDVMKGLGGSFWYVNGEGTDMRSNVVVSQDGHTLTCSATSSSAPQIYTPLYVMMPGEVNFGSVTLDWQEIGEVSNEVVVTVSGNTALVTGAVSADDVATIVSDAGSSAIIDLTSATLSESITIKPTNKNAIVVVDGTERTSDKIAQLGETKNIVVYDGTYRRAADGVVITLVDDNASQPAYDFVIDAQQDGISYTRTIAAGAYASVNSPAPITIPNSLAIYKATDATTSEITFTKQSVGGIGANESVILHNPTGEAVVLTSEVAKIDLNLTANPGGATIGESGVTQFGTARAVAADGLQFALQGGELKQFNTGATIGAFRVYYTGLSSASPAIAIFEDGEGTTAIKAIRNGEIVDGTVYDLQGRRVLNPTKGMYIINGKKVILK